MDNYSFEVISLIFRYLFDIMPVLIGPELKHETVLRGLQEPLFEQPGESPASCFEGGREEAVAHKDTLVSQGLGIIFPPLTLF